MPRKKEAIVVQSNRLIEARYRLSTLEQRLILSMASRVQSEDDDFFKYEIPLRELAELMGIEVTNAYNEIDGITEKLMGRVLHIRSKEGNLVKLHWICRAEHTKGTVILSFAPDLKPYLLHLKKEFTICQLAVVTRFTGKYTVRIYLLLKQYASIGWREFDLAELREIIGIAKGEYLEYKRFSQRVIWQAKKEMTAVDDHGRFLSDISFEVEPIKEGRKIVRLKFIIIKKKKKLAKSAKSSIGKAVENISSPVVNTPLQPQYYELPEYWFEFLEHLKKHDPGLLPIIETEGQNIGIVKYPYLKWKEKFKI